MNLLAKSKNALRTLAKWFKNRRLWQQIILVFLAGFLLFCSVLYSFAFWYQKRHDHEPLTYGTSFIAPYARSYGLDPKETLSALLNDLNFRHFRLVSYWSEIEKQPDIYDFSDLDWQFKMIEEASGKVNLAIGLRQPRWPECHMPEWAERLSKDQWYPELKDFMTRVIERYKDSPALHTYHLENEYFLGDFGICNDHERERLIEEYNLVKSLDDKHPIILSLSNNYFGIPVGKPRPDEYGMSIYRRVWEGRYIKRYFEYPYPSWYYAGRAGMIELVTGRKSMVHEFQMEPWGPASTQDLTIEEQNKSFNAERMKDYFHFAESSGFRTHYLWGAEWWYWRKVNFNDTSLWDTAKQELSKTQNR